MYFSARYPPYSEKKINYLSFLLRKRKGFSPKFLPYLVMFTLGVVATAVGRAILKVRTDTLQSFYPHLFFVLIYKQCSSFAHSVFPYCFVSCNVLKH